MGAPAGQFVAASVSEWTAFVSIGACRPKALRRMVHSWATIEPRNTQTTRKQSGANNGFLPGFRVVDLRVPVSKMVDESGGEPGSLDLGEVEAAAEEFPPV